MIQDPDYARIFTKARCVAWSYGYALLVHGTMTRDLDLLMVPWTEETRVEPRIVIMNMLQACEADGLELQTKEPTQKPHGRLAWTFIFKEFGDPRWIDVSAFPPADLVTKKRRSG